MFPNIHGLVRVPRVTVAPCEPPAVFNRNHCSGCTRDAPLFWRGHPACSKLLLWVSSTPMRHTPRFGMVVSRGGILIKNI